MAGASLPAMIDECFGGGNFKDESYHRMRGRFVLWVTWRTDGVPWGYSRSMRAG